MSHGRWIASGGAILKTDFIEWRRAETGPVRGAVPRPVHP